MTMGRRTTPRIAPIAQEDWDEPLTRIMAVAQNQGVKPVNIVSTIARHPDLFNSWLGLATFLLAGGEIPLRVRELAILRTAHHNQCSYEWAQHACLARELGLTDDEIAALREPLTHHDWQEDDRIVLNAVDEILNTGEVTDPTWKNLTGRYDDKQLMELVILVGHYTMLAFVVRTLRTPVEAWYDTTAV
ncbi:carboxymuconolactone decarboxylase family protein [Streptomyces sp. NPDC002564]|uniref:carboxymuconolactone decarboxylase family protein n=1 Tax=Streptomyces sp. NPDC002564 TaxID=3364649 RepID=UPI003675F7E2